MLLAKSVSQIAGAQNSFLVAVEAFNGITSDSVADLQRQIDVAQSEHAEQCLSQEQGLKKRKVEFDLELQEYKRKAAIDVLAETGHIPVLSEDLANLRGQLAQAEDQRANDLNALEKKLKSEGHAALAAAVKAQAMENKASSAVLEATSSQSAKEVTALKEQIAEQRDEIKLQRELTKSVAEASKQGAIQQSFGKQ